MEFTRVKLDDGVRVLIVSGSFAPGDDASSFEYEIKDYNPEAISLNSPGGNLSTAMAYGRKIRQFGLDTIQIKRLDCASSCALAFFGGVNRKAQPGSIGISQSSFSNMREPSPPDSKTEKNSAETDTISYMVKMGVDPDLMRLTEETKKNDIIYLTEIEMELYDVTARKRPAKPEKPFKVHDTSITSPAFEATLFLENKTSWSGQSFIRNGEVYWGSNEGMGNKDLFFSAAAFLPELIFELKASPDKDLTLPMNAVIDIRLYFVPPSPHGDVADVWGLVLKSKKSARGEPLIGVTTRVTRSHFSINLSKTEEDRKKNMNLIKELDWIGIPFEFEDGTRANLMIKKSGIASDIVEDVIDSWESEK